MEHYQPAAVTAAQQPRAAGREGLVLAPGGGVPVPGVPGRPRFCVQHKLVALPSAAGSARRFARAYARSWRLHDLADTAELLVSELVTSALTTAGAPEPKRYPDLYDSRLSFVILRMQAHGSGLIIEVWDRDPAPPFPGQGTAAGAEPAWRLRVVASLSRRWGHYPWRGGKVVWCECMPRPHQAKPSSAPAAAPRNIPPAVTVR